MGSKLRRPRLHVSRWSESTDIDHRPDLAMYPTHAKAAAAYTLTGKSLKKSQLKTAARIPHIARCAYQWMVTAIEVKPNGARRSHRTKTIIETLAGNVQTAEQGQ